MALDLTFPPRYVSSAPVFELAEQDDLFEDNPARRPDLILDPAVDDLPCEKLSPKGYQTALNLSLRHNIYWPEETARSVVEALACAAQPTAGKAASAELRETLFRLSSTVLIPDKEEAVQARVLAGEMDDDAYRAHLDQNHLVVSDGSGGQALTTLGKECYASVRAICHTMVMARVLYAEIEVKPGDPRHVMTMREPREDTWLVFMSHRNALRQQLIAEVETQALADRLAYALTHPGEVMTMPFNSAPEPVREDEGTLFRSPDTEPGVEEWFARDFSLGIQPLIEAIIRKSDAICAAMGRDVPVDRSPADGDPSP